MDLFPRIDIREAYQWLADIGFSQERIRGYVMERAGTLIPVSWPIGVCVKLADVASYAYFAQKWSAVCETGKYVCCGEKMAPFGRLHGDAIDRTRFIMMFGSSGGIYVYDAYDDTVFQLADSLDSFYADGLRRMDPIYDTAAVPSKILIDGVMASLIEAESVQAFMGIVQDNQGVIYEVSDTICGVDCQFMLYRGNYGIITSCSLGTSLNITSIMCAAIRRMSCTFSVFGVLGYKTGVTMFRPRLILLMDPFGVIYGYENCLNRLFRIAENFKMFTRIGSQKSIFNFRHDRGFKGIGRLEKPPYCPHVGNVREIDLDPDAEYDMDPQYVARMPNDSFSLRNISSFGEHVGHIMFIGRKTRFFDPERINKNQCAEGLITDVCSMYDAAVMMRAAYYGYKQITDNLWPEEIEALLLGHPSCLPMASDGLVKAAVESMRVMYAVSDDDDSDTESARVAINEPPCKRCIERRRVKTFKRLRGFDK
uniref:Tegument protein vICA n=1 Tax=Mastomys natalensis cytomegalovirus 1 TaxID=2973541 RepID=A0A9Y1N7K3_9BETA|nr:tegument protein vICA [Mastomys natalensis cytomegalovirus 1]WEG71128.1 tegument protein vICA [Mastomys natalensis cytomegalovirus 1]